MKLSEVIKWFLFEWLKIDQDFIYRYKYKVRISQLILIQVLGVKRVEF